MRINNYVGFEIREDKNWIYLTAEGYIKTLAETFEINEQDKQTIPHIANHYIDQEETSKVLEFKKKYQSLVGSITYICRVCRPDISFQTNMLAQCSNRPKMAHLNAGKRLIAYLLNTYSLGLRYKKGVSKFKAVAYSDASHAALNGRYSMTGYIIKVNELTLLYKTRKQKMIATSSTEAEIMACSLTVKELKWLQINLRFMDIELEEVILKSDNKGAVNKLSIKQSYSGIKQMEIEYFFYKNIIEKERWKVQHVKKEFNDADVFTKPVTKNWFIKNRDKWLYDTRMEEEENENKRE
eukprot:augustus_masked-scaffold_7-processed-gene-0.34-mRNA-1 protein AED:1.00 eAED:1.00 QI:0/-1/0/0/-1/1/1/0/295